MVWKCTVCDKILPNRDRLNFHRKRDHVDEPKTCTKCGESFKNPFYLTQHIRTRHNRKPMPCPICGKQFNGNGALDVHLISHNNERKFICDICGMKCKSLFNIRKHIKVIHCIKKIVNVRSLTRKERQFTREKRLTCKLCPIKFSECSGLKDHLNRKHHQLGLEVWENLLTVLCVKCSLEFSCPNKLSEHNESFHKFQCHICKQFFNMNETLQTHMTMHSQKERPYKCQVSNIMIVIINYFK